MASNWSIRICLGMVLVAGSGCGTQPSPADVDVTGTWVGTVHSNAGPPGYEPVFGDYTLTLVLAQAGSGVTGSLASSAFSGTVAGGVSGDRAVLAVAVAPCGGPGSATGSVSLVGTVRAGTSGPTLMDVTYQGTPCGVADYGAGTLSRP
jgi:hypothetical protein